MDNTINNHGSYLDMKDELKVRMNNITPDDLTISQIIPTIKEMYLAGANDIDDKWRKAVKIYAKKHNIKFAPGMINELFNIINSI